MIRLFFTTFFLIICVFTFSQEICDNGIDDNGDGLIDLNDPECECDGFGTPQTIPSLIPNPSFEDRVCCPTTFSQLHCADTWIQATSATSDYFNCGYNFGAATNAGITAHSGTGYVGAIFSASWREYVGACLLAPLVAGESYTLSFQIASVPMDPFGNVCNSNMNYGDIDVSIFGTSSCGNLPVNTTNCPSSASPNWNVIGSSTYTPNATWGTIQMEITPTVDINAIMIGPPCGTLPPGYQGNPCYAYFLFDDLILASNIFFNSVAIEEHGKFCEDNLYLEASTDSIGGTWQWYQEGIALVGETNSTLNISSNNYPAGTYQVKYTLGNKCDIAEHTVDLQYPVADFVFTEVCQGLASTFTDQSTFPLNGIVNWEWDFDNDQVFDDVGVNANHIFSGDGYHNVTLRITDSLGCQNEITQSVQVYPNPVADFSIDSVCLGLNTTIQDLSVINTVNGSSINSWDWDFGDGQSSTSATPTHLYVNPNVYTVKLVVESDYGCLDSIVKTTLIAANPVADFSIDSVCLGTNSVIQDLSAVNPINGNLITGWAWNFDDGNNSADPNLQNHLYTNADIYNVQLIVTTNNGCEDMITHTTVVSPVPIADFSIDSVCLGTNSSIQNLSSINSINGNSITSWNWNFGDGDNSIDENPLNHLYPDENLYNVQLIVESNNGCSDTIEKITAIYPNPVVTFTVPEVCLLSSSEFTDASTVSNTYTSNQITSWTWDFGDGNTTNLQSPTHTYSIDSIYTATLTILTNNGCSSTDSLNVTVYPNPTADFNVDSVCLESNSTFIDLSNINSYNGDQIVNWSWSFGDGATASIQNPTHLYGDENLYQIDLFVESNNGCSDSITKVTAIFPNPVVDFSPTEVCLNFTTNFLDQSTVSNLYTFNENVTWLWDFADGTTSSVQHPSHAYLADGVYDVELTVVTNNNCTSSEIIQVTVNPLPEIQFVGQELEGCSPICPTVTSTSTINSPGSIVDYRWVLDDGKVYQGASPSFTDCFENEYGFDISYDVQLIATSDKGCVSEHEELSFINVYHNPIADFTFIPEEPDVVHTEIEFENNSLYGDFYEWLIDGMNSTNEFSPSIVYPEEPKVYYATLIVTTDQGCVDTTTRVINIKDRVIFYVPNTFTPDKDYYNEVFKPIFSNGIDPQSYTLYIFNRWGELLFESHDTEVGWDGTYGVNNSGGHHIVRDGTYIWKIDFKETMTDKRHTYSGHVNLIK